MSFIRFCGDYRWGNAFFILPQQYIPRLQHQVEKAMGFQIFLDKDMNNAVHPSPLSDWLSQILAVQTTWGLVKPKFIPEGVSPASSHLQQRMYTKCSDFSD